LTDLFRFREAGSKNGVPAPDVDGAGVPACDVNGAGVPACDVDGAGVPERDVGGEAVFNTEATSFTASS